MKHGQLNDVEHFDQFSQDWWNPDGVFKTLHQVNPLRISFIQQHDTLKDLKVLDVGCGGGLLSEQLALSGARTTAIDLAQNSIDIAEKHAQEKKLKIDYKCQSLEELLAQSKEKFDMVCCFEMIEHTDNPQEIIKTIEQLLNPQGIFYVSTLNRNFLSWFLAIIMAENVLNWIPKGSHNLAKLIKPSELAQLARNNNFFLTHSTGIIWNPLTQSFSLATNRLEVNYIMRFQKL